MSERYSRLFSLPENLYAVGSPVVIAAGALLKDNQTGKVLAQLKLTNIQCKKIKAVRVKLFPQDTMGQPMGEAIDHQYLDLQLVRDGDFGSKTPILFPDATTRAFTVEVTSVVFADNTVWNSDGSIWEPIPDRVALHQRYDNLVIEQLRLEQNGACQFVVQEHKDLWLCTCGAVNHGGEAHCHNCGKQLSQIHPLDVVGLTERANLRLAEEAQQAAEEKAAREAAAEIAKKKTAKILKIVIPAICIIIAFVILLNTVILPNMKEKAALAELERQYNEAIYLMEQGDYKEALAIFTQLNGYEDSADRINTIENEFTYQEAMSYLDVEIYSDDYLAYQKAYDLFSEIEGYKDSSEYLADFEKHCVHIEYLGKQSDSVASETFFFYDQLGTVDHYGYKNWETGEKGTYKYVSKQFGNWYLNKLYYNGKSECKEYTISYGQPHNPSNTEVHGVTIRFEDEENMSVSFENNMLIISRKEDTWSDILRFFDNGCIETDINYSSTNQSIKEIQKVTFNNFGRREKVEHTEKITYGNGDVVTNINTYQYEYNDKMHCVLLKSARASSSKYSQDTSKTYNISIEYDADGDMVSYVGVNSKPRKYEYAMVYCPAMN